MRANPSASPRDHYLDRHLVTAPRVALDGVQYGSDAVTNFVRVRVATYAHGVHFDNRSFPISYSIEYVVLFQHAAPTVHSPLTKGRRACVWSTNVATTAAAAD